MNHTILFVDDEPRITNALKNVLRKEKYRILSADSAEKALEILSTETVDVVVSDEQMPGMSGSALISQIRREYPDTVRIILTGHANLDAALRAINEGEVYRYLTKPCNGLDLAITIRRALQHKKIMAKCRQLLQSNRKQSSFLQELEKQHHGITKLKTTSTGAIVLDEPDGDFDSLIQMIDKELRKTEKFFPSN